MILGIGNDMVDIRRVEKLLERFGERFEHKVFAAMERKKAVSRSGGNRNSKAAAYAKRFAAKEACAKALGTGIRNNVRFRDIVITSDAVNKPALELTGGAAKQLEKITPKGMHAKLDIAMTDEYPLTHAVVIISAVAA